jgi:hypothetical protein
MGLTTTTTTRTTTTTEPGLLCWTAPRLSQHLVGRRPIGHDVQVDPERKPPLEDRPLVWAVRKAAGKALEPDELLLGIEAGNLRRFRDNGVDQPVPRTKVWARAIPAARAVVGIAYTRRQVLFLGDGFAVNGPIAWVHHAQLVDRDGQAFAFGREKSRLAILEFGVGSHRSRQQDFLRGLMSARDEERERFSLPARELLTRIDAVIQDQTMAELWGRPPAPITTTRAELARLTEPRTGAATDGVDQPTWNRLRLLINSAHRQDPAGYEVTMKWEPPDFGLPGHQHTGLYLLYLLNLRVQEVLQANHPAAAQLHSLAATIYPRFRAVLERAEATQLEETLRTAFQMPPVGAGNTPAEFTIFAAAALGLLLDDADTELELLRPRLAGWWNQNHDSFVRQGLKE